MNDSGSLKQEEFESNKRKTYGKASRKTGAFCHEYLIDLNATPAVIRTVYSEKIASERGARLLTNVKVQNYIQELLILIMF